MNNTAVRDGCLVYVMGPSGAGKDAVISAVYEKFNKNNDLRMKTYSHSIVPGGFDVTS